MLILNVMITCLCAWGIANIFNRFIRRTTVNNYRFKLFAMRDRLTMLVVNNKVSVSDKDYQTLLRLLNQMIRIFDNNFSFAGFFKYLAAISLDKVIQRDVVQMVKRLKSHKNVELAKIACEYFELSQFLFAKYTHRTPLSVFLKLFDFSAQQIRKRIELEQKIDHNLEYNLNVLRSACA